MYGDNYGPQVPSGQTDYLTKAAALLDKASETNEKKHRDYAAWLIEGRERIARQYAVLGAIQRGVLPQEMAKELFDSVTETAR
jgi:hypothetical protein